MNVERLPDFLASLFALVIMVLGVTWMVRGSITGQGASSWATPERRQTLRIGLALIATLALLQLLINLFH